MTQEQIDKLIKRRNKLTDRRDGLTDSKVINRIDAQLRTVPTGARQDVDLLLGRVLPSYAVRWSSDEERETAKAHGETEAARLAAEMTDNYLMHIADQYDDMMDWHRIIGDLAL